VNVILLFPALFEPEEFGLTRVLVAVIGVAAQFALLGISNAIIRFFPEFSENDKDNHGLLGLSTRVALVGVVVVSVILLLAQPWVIAHYHDKSGLFVDYYYLLFPYLIFEVYNQIFTSYTRAVYHSVVNVFFREVFLRMGVTLIIGLYWLKLVDFDGFMLLFIGLYGLMTVGLLFYLIRIGQFNLKLDKSFLTTEMRKRLAHYGTFTLLTNVSSLMLMSIDVIMISAMIGLGETAFYSVAFYIVALLNIPRNAIGNISVPIISQAWKDNDLGLIQQIYAKTSINQLLIGTLILVGLWANEHNIFQILPDKYAGGKWVLLITGIARLADVGFGINGGIITTSNWYKFDTYANIFLIIITVLLNLVFIPKYGINGAALATAISLTSFQLARYTFLKVKFKFEPFTSKSLLTLLLGALAYFISSLIPEQSLYVDIVLRSLTIVAIYVPLAVAFKLSEDVNELLRVVVQKIKR
jgi:O-antigen/teichoic acid export membrane protein